MSKDNFPDLTKNLDSWAEFVVDSPVAAFLRKRLTTDLLNRAYPNAPSSLLADLAAFMSAIYAGGLAAGRASVDTGVKYTTLYIASTGGDDHGRGDELIGIYTTSAAAEATVKGRGWFGGNGAVKKADGYFVGDLVIFPNIKIDAVDLNVDLPRKVETQRAAALAKLTPEERKLLGLKEA